MENGHNRLRQAQDDVEEVKTIMLNNLEKSEERTTKLVDLENRAVELRQKGEAFQKTSTKVKQKKQWENNKFKVILGAVVGVVIFVILVFIIISVSSEHETENKSGSPIIRTVTPAQETENKSGSPIILTVTPAQETENRSGSP